MRTSISKAHASDTIPYSDGILAFRLSDGWKWLRATWVPTFFTMILIGVVVATVIMVFPRTYRSRAKLLLRLGRESVTLDPASAATGQMMQMHQTRENEIETALGVMSSRLLMEHVVDEVGVQAILDGKRVVEPVIATNKPSKVAVPKFVTDKVADLKVWLSSIDPEPDRERAIRELDKHFSISAGTDSSVVEIEFRTGSAQLAHEIVECWVKTYIAKHGEFNRTPGALAFFQQEQQRLTEQLAQAHRLLREAKDDASLLTVSGQQEIVEKELASVRQSLNLVDAELAAGQSSVTELERQLALLEGSAVIESVSGSSESRDEMRARVFDLQLIEKDLASRYTSDHPKMAMTKRQLEETRRVLAEQNDQKDQVVRGINPTFQRIETELTLQRATTEPLVKKRDTIAAQLKKLMDEVQALNKQSEHIAALERELGVLDAQYVTHSERLDQARLEEVLQKQQISSVREIQPASFEARPVTPNKLLCIVFGALAMLSAGCGIPIWLGPGRVYRKTGVLPQRHSFKDWDRLSNYEEFGGYDPDEPIGKLKSRKDQDSEDAKPEDTPEDSEELAPKIMGPVDVRDDH